MEIHKFREMVDSIDNSLRDYDDKEVTVVVSGTGIGSTPSSRVKSVESGIDFDNWQVMIYTEDKLKKQIDERKIPLTIERLRKMDADVKTCRWWVWIEVLKPFSCGSKVSAYYQTQSDYTEGEAFCCGYPGMGYGFDYSDYGKTWLAYISKPEEDGQK